jgi:hypothetical protein
LVFFFLLLHVASFWRLKNSHMACF